MNINETVRARPAAPNEMFVFVFDGLNAPKAIDLTSFGKTEITFGRDAGSDIVLTSHLASRHHGAFVLENGHWFVVDKGSTNGIIHNGHEEAETALHEDDFIRIDDGVETVADGVLMLFPSKEYSASWVTTPIVEAKTYLSSMPTFAAANIEQRDGKLCIEFGSADSVLINQRRATGKTILHEKDVISVLGHRIVFTSAAIYDNLQVCIQENTKSGFEGASYGRSEEKPVINGSETGKQNEGPFAEPHVTESAQKEYQHYNDYREQEYQQQNDYSSSQRLSGGFRNFLASPAGYYTMSILIALIIWGITAAIWLAEGEAALVVIIACAFFGWKALNSIQPAMFLWMSWVGWLIYFSIKFFLSAVIGLFVAPFKIGKWIAGAISQSV